jgi:HEAT repeat protein
MAFRSALMNLQLYPPGNQQVTRSVKEFHALLVALIGDADQVELGEAEGHLLVDGAPLRASAADASLAAAIVESFNRVGLSAVAFHRGVREEEIATFLWGFGNRRLQEQGLGALKEFLAGNNIERVEVREGVFVREGAGPGEGEGEGAGPGEGGLGEGEGGGDGEGQDGEGGVRYALHRTQELLAMDLDELVNERVRRELPTLLKKLDQLGETGQIEQVVDRLLEGVHLGQGVTRVRASETLTELLPTVQNLSDPSILRELEDIFVVAVELEGDEKVYLLLADILVRRSTAALQAGDQETAKRIVGMFWSHAAGQDDGFPGREQLASQALDQLAAGGIVAMLVDALDDDAEAERQTAARAILGMLSGRAVVPLVREVRQRAEARQRHRIASLLADLGEVAADALGAELNGDANDIEIRRLLEVMPRVGHPAPMARHLRTALATPDTALRVEIVRVLGRLGGDVAGEALVKALDDGSDDVRIEAVRGLGESRYRRAGHALVNLVTAGSWWSASEDVMRVRAEACVALGQIGDRQHVAALLGVLWPTGLAKLARGKLSTLRVAAVRGLKSFPTPEVRRAIEAAAEDKDARVQAAARAVLKTL